jgi:hypothetical protein
MKLAIYNHLNNTHQEVEGDAYTVQRLLIQMFPHIVEHYPFGSIDDMIDYIDSMQHRSVEVVDESEHPLLKV